MKDSVVVGKVDCNMAAEDDHCEKNDNYSAIAHPAWMINTLFEIDCLAQYELSI
mgnify:FL=1